MAETIRAMWDRYLEGLCTVDIQLLSQNYEQNATLRISNLATASGVVVYNGMADITEGLQKLLKCFRDMSSFAIHNELVEEKAIGDRGHIFATWSCSSSGVAEASETVIVSENHKIESHAITYFQSSPPI